MVIMESEGPEPTDWTGKAHSAVRCMCWVSLIVNLSAGVSAAPVYRPFNWFTAAMLIILVSQQEIAIRKHNQEV